jgi:hypothetical protein
MMSKTSQAARIYPGSTFMAGENSQLSTDGEPLAKMRFPANPDESCLGPPSTIAEVRTRRDSFRMSSWLSRAKRYFASPPVAGKASKGPVKLVLVSDMFERHGGEHLPRDVQAFVYGLMGEGLTFEDFPREAVLSAAVGFYLAEVANGGHAGFLGNSEAYPANFEQISEGLELIGLSDVAAIFADLLAYENEDPENFGAADWEDPVLQSLDDRLNPITRSAQLRHAEWLKAQGFIRIVPGHEYSWRLVTESYRSGGLGALH